MRFACLFSCQKSLRNTYVFLCFSLLRRKTKTKAAVFFLQQFVLKPELAQRGVTHRVKHFVHHSRKTQTRNPDFSPIRLCLKASYLLLQQGFVKCLTILTEIQAHTKRILGASPAPTKRFPFEMSPACSAQIQKGSPVIFAPIKISRMWNHLPRIVLRVPNRIQRIYSASTADVVRFGSISFRLGLIWLDLYAIWFDLAAKFGCDFV